METFFAVFPAVVVFILGAVIGSFLNVCIYRMPRNESVVSPGSHCPHCSRAVRPHDNIPLISWLLLGGKCRDCKGKISPRYFFVELANGLLWLFLWFFYAGQPAAAAAAVLFSLLLAVTITDIETGLIPDLLSLPGIVLGLVCSGVWPELQRETVWYWGLAKSGLGILAGGGVLLGMGYVGNAGVYTARRLGVLARRNKFWRLKLKRYRGVKDTMGGGDIKLLAMMGAFMGPGRVFLIFLLAPFIAILPMLYMKARSEKDLVFIPYGPFLAAAGAASFLWGDTITAFILKTYGVTNA